MGVFTGDEENVYYALFCWPGFICAVESLVMRFDLRTGIKMFQPARMQSGLTRLLVAGAVLHLLSTSLVYVIGQAGVLPSMILPTGALEGDSGLYLEKSVALGRDLSGLISSDTQFHIRLYALSSAVLTPILGANILSVELLNLFLYLLMLFFTYKVGELCFDARAGFIAAIIVGLFPSLLFHTTQPLRDSLFIVLMLLFLWLVVSLLTIPTNFARIITHAASGCATLMLLWLVRDSLWPVYVAITALALITLGIVSVKHRQVPVFKFACLLLFLVVLFLIPVAFASWLPPKEVLTSAQEKTIEEFRSQQIRGGVSGIILKISVLRQRFIVLYSESGSNIDSERNFRDAADVLLYMPRAVAVGLFAPFPKHWVGEGKKFGRVGRIIAGAETCFFYLLYLFALAGIWLSRRSPQTWFLLAVLLLGAAALGLIVVNLGALYRMRYFFWILLVILSAAGWRRYLIPNPLAPFFAQLREQGV